jgi:hypothetical protein
MALAPSIATHPLGKESKECPEYSIECAHMALKPRPKLANRLLVPLRVVEEGEEGGERVGDGGRADIVLQDLHHIKVLSIEYRT